MAADGKICVLGRERKYISRVSLAPRPFRYANTVYRPRNSLLGHASPAHGPATSMRDGIRGERKSGEGGGRDLEEMDAAVKCGRADFPRASIEGSAAFRSSVSAYSAGIDSRHHGMTSLISAMLYR